MQNSPLTVARLTGFFWLLTIVAGFLALFLRGVPGTVANAVATATYLAATFFVAKLLMPVSRNLAMLTAVLGIMGCALGLDRMFLKILPTMVNGTFLFFGSQCFLLGILIFRSTYIPRWVGAVLSFGGLGWITFGLTSIFAPSAARSLSLMMFPGIVGETCLTLWLLIKGIDVAKWDEVMRRT